MYKRQILNAAAKGRLDRSFVFFLYFNDVRDNTDDAGIFIFLLHDAADASTVALLTLPIAKEGYDITGIDYTPSMLAQAKIRCV